MMLRMIGAVVAVAFMFISCATTGGPSAGDIGIKIPKRFKQEDYIPKEKTNFYESQAILRAELGARFYNRGETDDAIEYFSDALDYDQYNNKAHFSLGLIYYEEGKFEDALKHLQKVRRVAEPLFPYDIDYHKAAEMVLSYFPFQTKVTAPYQNEMVGEEGDKIILNKGANQGVRVGMDFSIYRVGNAIRDVESLEIIGTQRTRIGQAEIVEIEDNNSVAQIMNMETNYFVQIDDLLETEYLEKERLEDKDSNVDEDEQTEVAQW